MNRSFLQMLVRRAEHVAARPGTDAPGDEQLLARFAREGDEAAFAALVARHGRLVWSVCRGLLPRDADAEDAFQATFLALVRGAKSIRASASLAPWLHVTATRVCKKVRLTAARRNGREHRAAVREATPSPVPEAAWEAASLAVHEEIAALSPTLRTAFVTCVLEGERHQDAAARLGVPVGTLSARVSRARQTLLDRLGARGLSPGVAAAALALGGAAGPAAVPDILTEAVRGLLPAGTSATPYLITLATTATDGVTMKAKMLAAAVLIAGAASFTTGGWVLNRADAQSAAAAPPVPTANAPRYADPNVRAPQSAAPTLRADTITTAAAWQYELTIRPKKLEVFRDLLASKSGAGWEFVGSELLDDGGSDPRVYCVFKKSVTYRRLSNPLTSADAFGGGDDNVPSPAPLYRTPDAAPSRDALPFPTPPTRPAPSSIPAPRPALPVPERVEDLLSNPSRPLLDLTRDESTKSAPRAATDLPVPTDRIDRIVMRNVAVADVVPAVKQFLQKKYGAKAASFRVIEDVRTNSLLVQSDDASVMKDVFDLLKSLDAPSDLTVPLPSNTIPPPRRAVPDTFNPSNMIPPPARPTLRDLYEKEAPPISAVVTVNNIVPSRAQKALLAYLLASVPDAPQLTINADDAKKRIDLKGPSELVKKLAGLVRELDRETPPLPPVTKP